MLFKNEILPFATTWMDLKGIMLSEINSTEKDKYSELSLTCGILVPQSATEPEFPALEGGFLTTGHWEISQINFKKNFLFFFKKKIFFIEG